MTPKEVERLSEFANESEESGLEDENAWCCKNSRNRPIHLRSMERKEFGFSSDTSPNVVTGKEAEFADPAI